MVRLFSPNGLQSAREAPYRARTDSGGRPKPRTMSATGPDAVRSRPSASGPVMATTTTGRPISWSGRSSPTNLDKAAWSWLWSGCVGDSPRASVMPQRAPSDATPGSVPGAVMPSSGAAVRARARSRILRERSGSSSSIVITDGDSRRPTARAEVTARSSARISSVVDASRCVVEVVTSHEPRTAETNLSATGRSLRACSRCRSWVSRRGCGGSATGRGESAPPTGSCRWGATAPTTTAASWSGLPNQPTPCSFIRSVRRPLILSPGFSPASVRASMWSVGHGVPSLTRKISRVRPAAPALRYSSSVIDRPSGFSGPGSGTKP